MGRGRRQRTLPMARDGADGANGTHGHPAGLPIGEHALHVADGGVSRGGAQRARLHRHQRRDSAALHLLRAASLHQGHLAYWRPHDRSDVGDRRWWRLHGLPWRQHLGRALRLGRHRADQPHDAGSTLRQPRGCAGLPSRRAWPGAALSDAQQSRSLLDQRLLPLLPPAVNLLRDGSHGRPDARRHQRHHPGRPVRRLLDG